MRYQRGAQIGPDQRYTIQSVPATLLQRGNAGSYLHRGLGADCGERPVTVRTVRYTNHEFAHGDAGVRAGRARFDRMITLLNRVEAVVFPELLDRFEDRNITDDFSDSTLATREPVLVFQELAGDDLDALLSRRYFALDRSDGDAPVHRVHVPRLARMFRRVVLLAQSLLAGGTAHVDLSPAHILILPNDEIPRLLGPGHLVELASGSIVDDDPALRFTSAGFASPELVSTTYAWGLGASGEAVMLYGIGATMLATVLGGSALLVERCLRDGPEGALALALETRDAVATDAAPHANSRARFVEFAAKLLAQDPAERLAHNTLDALAPALELLAGDRLTDALKDLACAQCSRTFRGDPERHAFDYAGTSFALCRTCRAAALTRVTRRAPKCGCEFVERAGDDWARSRVGHAPRQWCPKHKAARVGSP
jgi:hypothetical protein